MVATTSLSRKKPTKGLSERTVAVRAGLPKDRIKGYKDDRTGFTGADAQLALVGAYKKSKKKAGKSFGSK